MKKINDITPLSDIVLVKGLEFGERITKSGIILLDDDGTDKGIHPRWAQIWRCGKNATDIKEGDWVLIDHGRWARSFDISPDGEQSFKVNRIDYPEAILVVADKKPDFLD